MYLREAGRTILRALAFAVVCAATASAGASDAGTKQAQSTQQPEADQMNTYQGQTVDAIHWVGVSSEAEQKRWAGLISQKAGQPLDRDLIRESIHELYATGRFADIRIEAERDAEGRVVLSIITSPNYFVGAVRVEGAPNRPTPGQIVNSAKLPLGEPYTSDKLEEGLTNIKQLMESNGYYRSAVNPEENFDADAQQVAIVFHVTPGARAHVGNVEVKCDPACSQPEILRAAKLRPGQPVSVQLVSSALERLRKRYQKQNRLLAQVALAKKSYRPEADAVDYVLNVVPGPKVVVLAQGFKISRHVLKQNVPIFEENTVDEDLLNEGRRNLLNYMQGLGYFGATVGLKRQGAAGGSELQIVYDINAGARHRLVKVEITGNQYFRTETLRTRLQVQPAGRLLEHGRYSQALLAKDGRNLENLYRANGFQDVKITPDVIDDFEGRENDDAIRLTIAEGLQTRIGTFHLVGNHVFSEAQLKREILTGEGQPFSEADIAEDRDNLLNYYFNRGYPHATFEATAKPTPGQDHRMDVTFTLHEGELVSVDHVYLSGLNHTRPYVARRELQMGPGDPLSQIDIMQSQQKMYDLGIFSQVDTAVQNPDGSEPTKNVLVDVQEAKRYTFLYGIGLEFQTGLPTAIGTNQSLGQTGVSPRVSLAVSRLNFQGRNHTITFKADVGSLEQRGSITYLDPRFLGSLRWKLSFTALYDNTLDVTTFTSQRLEGSVQFVQTINKTSTMDYSFTYRRVKATDIQISPTEIPLLSLPVRVGEPGLTYIRNTRDNDLNPTKGSFITGTAGVASGYFGSEADFSKVLIQHASYHAFGKNRLQDKKFVFARSTQVGVENAFGNTSILPPGQGCPDPTQTNCPNATVIPLAERFLAGGGNSHRGFGLNQAGPRDPTTGFPLGGSALFLNSVEMRFPPPTLPYAHDNMSFALFWDAGNVFDDGRHMLDNLLRWRQKDPGMCLQDSIAARDCDYSYVSSAVGIGVRYKTPIGPVRFDFGYNLNPPAFPSCQATPSYTGEAKSPVFCTLPVSGTSTLPYFDPQHASHFNVYFSIGQTF